MLQVINATTAELMQPQPKSVFSRTHWLVSTNSLIQKNCIAPTAKAPLSQISILQ